MTAMPNVGPGDRVVIVVDGETLHRVVTTVHADGSFDVADPGAPALSPLVESLFRGEYSDRRFVVHVPDAAIPNGSGGWWLPGPPPPLDGEEPAGADLSGWADAGYVDEVGPVAPALGLEPHHARGKERTDEEQAALEPYDNGGSLPSALEWWRNDTGQPIPLDGKEPFPPGLTRVSDGEVTR